jgi:hypothetical protein
MQHRLDIGMRNYLTLRIHCGLIADIQFFHAAGLMDFLRTLRLATARLLRAMHLKDYPSRSGCRNTAIDADGLIKLCAQLCLCPRDWTGRYLSDGSE